MIDVVVNYVVVLVFVFFLMGFGDGFCFWIIIYMFNF